VSRVGDVVHRDHELHLEVVLDLAEALQFGLALDDDARRATVAEQVFDLPATRPG